MSSKLTIATSCCTAERVHGPDRADRDQVLGREQRRGRIAAAEQLACGLIRIDSTELRMADQLEILSEAVLRERLPVAPQALRGGEHVRPVTEEPDPAMPGGDQVGDRGARAADVVGEHRVGVDEPGRAVDEHRARCRPRDRAAGRSCRARRWRRSARRPRARLNAAASSRSRSGSSSELPTSVRIPRSRATSSTPRCTAPKNGFDTSSKIRPMLADWRSARRSVLAVRLCR